MLFDLNNLKIFFFTVKTFYFGTIKFNHCTNLSLKIAFFLIIIVSINKHAGTLFLIKSNKRAKFLKLLINLMVSTNGRF
jgi:hypothetical protein